MAKTTKPGVGLRSIMVNFDFGKLLKKMEKDPNFLTIRQIKVNAAKKIAEGARTNLKSGNFTNNLINEATKDIRERRGRQRTPPLIDTGRLLRSIRHKGEEVWMENYGGNHLKGYRIKSNEFTRKHHIKAGTRVPKRDFLPKSIKLDKKVNKTLVRHINKSLKTKTRRIGVSK